MNALNLCRFFCSNATIIWKVTLQLHQNLTLIYSLAQSFICLKIMLPVRLAWKLVSTDIKESKIFSLSSFINCSKSQHMSSLWCQSFFEVLSSFDAYLYRIFFNLSITLKTILGTIFSHLYFTRILYTLVYRICFIGYCFWDLMITCSLHSGCSLLI